MPESTLTASKTSKVIEHQLPREKTPQKPRLVIRVGVTGHRMNILPPEGKDQELRNSVHRVLEAIRSTTNEIYEQGKISNTNFYADNQPEIRVISPLAEGADRLVAEAAVDLKMELQCPLPFSRIEYERDFQSESSKAAYRRLLAEAKIIFELDGPTEQERRQEAYEMVGRVVLWNCDLLIAIWDQEPPHGVGGTGQMVQEALASGIPVIWIDPYTKSPPHLRTLGGQSQSPVVQRDLSLLHKRLKSIIQLPATAVEVKSAKQFFEETQPRRNPGFLFKAFCKIWAWHWGLPRLSINNFQETVYKEWRQIWQSLRLNEQRDKTGSEATDPLDTGYLKPFAWTDGLAEFYANKYRSSLVATYLMGALAILFAYLGSLPCMDHKVFAGLEVTLILSIIILIFRGRALGWHGRWMDYRALAEELRQAQFLSFLGRVISPLKVPRHLEPGDLRNKWFNWYFRAISRQVGLIRAHLDNSYVDSYRQVLDSWIQSQRDYHGRNADLYHKLYKHLQIVSHVLFFAALSSCSLHFFDSGHRFAVMLTFGTIVFPAFGGAIGAILHIGEFERVAFLGTTLKKDLEMLSCQLRCMSESVSSQDLGHLAQEFSDLTLAELVDWRYMLISKDLELPA